MTTAVGRARAWFALQALTGLVWWAAVAWSDDVRRWTLGTWPAARVAIPDLLLFSGAAAMAAWRGSRGWALASTAWTVAVTVGLSVYALSTRQAGWGAAAMVVASLGGITATATLWFGRLPLEWFFRGPFGFRVAAARTPARHLLHSIGQVIVFWSFFLLFLPAMLSWIEHRLRLSWPVLDHRAVASIGVLLFVCGSIVGLWSMATMAVRGRGTPLPAATARHLVVTGPYRSVRNPMAVAGAVQTVGVGLWLGAWSVVVTAVVGGVMWHLLIRPGEEADLLARFGQPYEAYRTKVRCWIPRRPIPTATIR
ncbi:MAG: methyltransferase family protein [Ilumatobacteraceae bacterium]